MPPRLRPTRLEYVVDPQRLHSHINLAAPDVRGDAPKDVRGDAPGDPRRRMLEILKGALFRGRMIAKERLRRHRCGGA